MNSNHTRIFIFAAFLTAFLLCHVAPAAAQTDPENTRVLRVATKEAAPFVMKDGETWSGISIELWRYIARELEVEYEFVETDLEGLISTLESGEADLSIAAITVTAEREARIDFTHPFYTSGLAIAVESETAGGWLATLRGLFSLDFLLAIAALLVVLMSVGALVWAFERRRNTEQFGGPPHQGLGAGFWFSAVTMTTVGYGDKAPMTFGGRLITLIWMFASVITISGFTAAIASTLTAEHFQREINGPNDLPGKVVGTVPESTSEAYLRSRSVPPRDFETADDALDALAAGRIDAAIYDAPMLRYLVNEHHAGDVTVLPHTFERQDYAAAVPVETDLREPINRAIVEFMTVGGVEGNPRQVPGRLKSRCRAPGTTARSAP